MSTVTVLVIVNGTVREETHTAERITFQHRRNRNGSLHLKLWRDGQMAEQITYRRCERLHHVEGPEASA